MASSQRPAPALRPKAGVHSGLHQPRRNANLVSEPPYGTSQNVVDFQALGDLGKLQFLPLEGERGYARCHTKVGDPCQEIQKLLGDPVREEFLIRIGAHVGKGQDGNGY